MGLIESLVPATAEAQAAFEAAQAKRTSDAGHRLLLTCAADVVPEAIVWLWPGGLPAGKISILAGSPGTGKTTLALAMAAIVTMGDAWPDGSRMKKPGSVLIWSSEDDPADTLVPRLMAAGADLRRIHFAQAVADENGELQPFDPARDMHLLSKRLAEMGGADLLIVDPIVSAVSGDAHRVNDVRRNLQDLVNVAAAHRCAVLGISHFAKGTRGTSPAERVIGSQAFVALARMVLVAGKDEAAERRILARAKSNISPDDGGVSYSIEQVEAGVGITASRIVWGELIQGTAREILGDVEQDQNEERSLKDEARDFLSGLLADGPVNARELRKDADGAGFSWPTIHRAAAELGVEKRKLGMKEGWVWALSKISGSEDFSKISTLPTVKSSVGREIFGSGAGLRGAVSITRPEDFKVKGVRSSSQSSAGMPSAEVRHEEDEPRHFLNGGGLRESWRSSGIARVSGEGKTATSAEDREDRHGTGSGGVQAETDESEDEL
ncbi:AAA family ATPase [Ralstonia nicotianae]